MKITTAILREAGLPRAYADSRPLTIETAELGDPGDGELLVEIKAAGLCHSDLSVIDNNRPRPLPMALGHEAAGVVRAAGRGVTDMAEGDHVVLVFVPSCGHCLPCATGRPALCEPGAAANAEGTLLSGARRIDTHTGTVNHHLGVSAFSSHIVVDRRSAVKIDRDLPFTEAALFGCAVLTGVGAAFNTARIQPGSSVAVIGLGGVGLNALLGARAAGASWIAAVDIEPGKLSLAQELGADAVFDSRDPDCAAQLREASGGGVECALEMAGVAPALELAWQVTRRGGTTVTAGLPHPDARLSLSPAMLVGEERTLKGSYLGGGVPLRDIPRYIAMYRAGLLPVDRLLGESMALEHINAGFDAMAEGTALRQTVVF
ncbi:MAG: alcohol dehydrogenase catalytic domain-containing protein [Erythrobacter sp.]|nr:alcohol dehydrogenase catalytic domain-containing protein [Erythrobacter sp.]NCQ64965.1 alcohol dehydrogenase catalytic domain-containing protein [Alphaproteobacteria bacterium]